LGNLNATLDKAAKKAKALFSETGLIMNLADELIQRILTELCIKRDIKVIILDNLSCLFSGLKENEWEIFEYSPIRTSSPCWTLTEYRSAIPAE
jgi:hypothetical protein